jgi:hypothetical protein
MQDSSGQLPLLEHPSLLIQGLSIKAEIRRTLYEFIDRIGSHPCKPYMIYYIMKAFGCRSKVFGGMRRRYSFLKQMRILYKLHVGKTSPFS